MTSHNRGFFLDKNVCLESPPQTPPQTAIKKKKKLIYNYCHLFSHSLVPWTRSGACSVVRLDFFCARKALRHHCIAYVWYDEMWNQRTGQCRYRAMCVFLCASLRWHLIVMNFKAGSRGSDSIGQFMKTVGGIRALYVCADRTESHSGIRRPWGWRAVCLVYAVSVGYVFMYVWSKQWLWNSTPLGQASIHPAIVSIQ